MTITALDQTKPFKMIYNTPKRDELFFSAELKCMVHKGKPISSDQAEKLKHKWAKKDLLSNANNDLDFTPMTLEVFKTLVDHLSARELTAKNQSLTYHSLKRYVLCIFNYYLVHTRDTPLSKQKRPCSVPKLNQDETAWKSGERKDGAYVYSGVIYNGPEQETELFKRITVSELSQYAVKDEQLAQCAMNTGIPLFSEFSEIAYINNDLKQHTADVYEYLKYMIITIDRHFSLEPKAQVTAKVEKDRLTGFLRYRFT